LAVPRLHQTIGSLQPVAFVPQFETSLLDAGLWQWCQSRSGDCCLDLV